MTMAATMCANTAIAGSLLQRSSSRESTSSSLVNFPSWSRQILVRACSKNGIAKEWSEKNVAVRATIAYRDVDSESHTKTEQNTSTTEFLCCPICFKPLSRTGPRGMTQAAIARSGFACERCKRDFFNTGDYLDLTILEGTKVYDEETTAGEDMFRSPLVSFVYERGWRQNFAKAGFPGPDEEFKMAQNYLKSVKGGVLLDLSCGSGLFSRRFAQSGDYESVIALDYSENMLRQSNEYIRQDGSLRSSNIALVRADVARLPFASGSIDAVHAGAALHCWPSPLAGMAEVSRILKPGGVFVASTFLTTIPLIDFGLHNGLRRAIRGAMSANLIRYWEESELEELCGACGLVEYSRVRSNLFIMLSAKRAEAR